MNYVQCINVLMDEGFQVKIGKHTHGKGYFASITKDNQLCNWDQSGHGWAKKEALENARLIAKGHKPITAYKIADFEKPEKGTIIWVRKEAILGARCNQRATIIKTTISDRYTASLWIRLLRNGRHYWISPCSIVGVEFDETLTVNFKYNGYTIQENNENS